MRVRSLGQEDSLEKEIATHSSVLAQGIPWTEKPGGLAVRRVAKSWTRLKSLTHKQDSFLPYLLSLSLKSLLLLLLSHFSRVRLFVTPWTIAYQAPLSMGFSRQEYWSGLLFPSPGNLPDPGIEPGSPALQADSLLTGPPGKTSLQKGCINLFYSRVGRDKLSLLELNKGTLVYSQAEGQGPPSKPLSMIIVSKVMKSKSKKKFSTWSQNWLSSCNKMKEPHFTFPGNRHGQ